MKKLLPGVVLLLVAAAGFAQAPVITYQSPQNYIVGKAIDNLAPANAGGDVPAAVFGQVTTFAGTGTKGALNGTGNSATFNEPYGLTTDSHGNIYVADYSNNLIRKITPAGLVSTFVPASAGLSLPTGLAMDASDNLYIADGGNNQVKKVTPAGVISVIAGTGDYGFAIGPALSSSFKSPSGVAVDAAGNVYVSDFGNQQIRKIAGGMVSVLAGTGVGGFVNGTIAVARFNGPYGVATDAAGNVYVADIGNNAIRKITPAGLVSTFAGSGVAGSVDGTGTAATFARPYGVTVDALGNVYVSDSNNSLVRKITPAGVVTTLAGNSGNFGKVDATGTDAVFSFPIGITTDGNGNLYTADNSTSVIRKVAITGYIISPALPAGLNFDATTGIISGAPTVASPAQNYTVRAYNNSGSSSSTINITTRLISADASLSSLATTGVTLNPSFSPSQHNFVMTVPETTTSVTLTPSLADANATLTINGALMISGTPFVMPVNTGGNTTTIQITAEDGVTTGTYMVSVIRPRKAVAAPAIAYITPQQYTVNLAIPPLAPQNSGGSVPANAYGAVTTLKSGLADVTAIAVDPSGNVYTTNVANNIIQKITPGGAVSTFATGFNSPNGLSADALGNIYIADSGNNMIKKATSSGVVSIVSGKSGDFDFADGDADTAAKYRYPIGIATDGSGNIFIGDQLNYDVRKISLAGLVTTIAGNNSVGSANGTGAAASFNEPFGVATDLAGNVYVADSKNNLIRKITPAGAVSTMAGSGAAGQANATGTAASFDTPYGVATDVLGNVYVADAANSLIRKITPAGVVSRLAGSGYYNFADGTGALAAFSYPTAIAADADGQLYVADNGNKAVRKIQTTGFAINPTTLPAGLVFNATTGTISGTPTVVTAPANYTITAYNLGGSSSATVNIRINAANNDATLKSLVLSTGTLSPAFNSGMLTYTTGNTGNASFIKLIPTSTQASAIIKVNGTTVLSGSASANLPLAVGPNVFTIAVTATDGVTTKNYQLTVNRPVPVYATDASLSSLTTTNATFLPSFNSNTVTYTATVIGTVTGLTLTPLSSESHATIAVNGNALVSGTESGNIPLNYGSNTVTVKVTAEDGVTVKTYTLTVIRQASANADLTGITLSNGDLTPNFSATGLTYTAEVGNAVSNITVTPYTADATANVKVNGTTVTSGAASGAIPLVIGSNVITIAVAAQDNATVKNYEVSVLRDPSSNATLSALTPSSGTLSTTFDPATTSYTSSVPNAVTSITLTPISGDVNQIITINGTAVASGISSTSIPLSAGNNPIAIQVTAEDGITIKNYLLTVTRLPSADAGLAGLKTDQGDLFPTFTTGNATYSATVSNTSAFIKITPTVNEPNATVIVNGVSVASGNPSGDIALNVGPNVITVTVTAQDGVTTKTYSITINRTGSNNADLASLGINPGSLTEVFSPGLTSYSATVINTTNSIKLIPAVSEVNASVTINGVGVASGVASGSIPLTVGPNIITAAVTAQDGKTIKKYTVTVTREPSTNADLTNITLSTGALNEVFAAGALNYSANVLNTEGSIRLKPTVSDGTATITVNGIAVAGGAFSGNIPLTVGPNVITIIATAQDGITTKTYAVTIKRQPSANADLADISLSAGTMKPPFSTGVADYNVSVNNIVDNIALTPTVSDVTATVTVNGVSVASGTASGSMPLNVGPNIITIKVTAQDGVTAKTYTVTVNRTGSSNADLASLGITPGSLKEVFSPGLKAYSATVSNTTTAIKLIPALSEANASVTINGVAVASGVASADIPLNVGPNIITASVTAQDGTTTKNYKVTVTRQSLANADLANIALSAGSLNEVFAAGTLDYSADVLNTDATIRLKATVSDATATITVNGAAVASGSFSGNIALNVGPNVITTVVTAQDGIATKTYTVTVNRAPSADANLAALVPGAGKLDPLFAQEIVAYTLPVPNAVTGITFSPTVNEANASVKINGTTVSSGSASHSFPLVVGSTVITIVVTAQDGLTTKTYTVSVIRQKSTDATLSSIALTDGTLTLPFSSGVNTYTAIVPNTVSTISLKPVANESNATITINGAAVDSGALSNPIGLVVGPNIITTIVTAQDGITTQTYSITVTRKPSSDASLADLKLSSKTLSPAISSGSLLYNASVENDVKTITFTPIVNQPDATVTINGITVASGSASAAIPLKVGDNTITTVVTAQDGVTTKSYISTVNRAPSTNANLAALSVVPDQLNITFNKLITGYSMLLKNDITSAVVTPTVEDATARVVINGITVASGSASPPISLSVGNTPITIVVTAEDGKTKKTYVIIANRALSSDNDLADLILSSGTLKPGFESGLNNYNASVPNAVASINVKPILADAAASVKVNGVAVSSGSVSPEIKLNVGPNTITAVVTAQNTETNTYTIIVNRDPSKDANLVNLSLSSGSLSPAFTIGNETYVDTVLNTVNTIKITPTLEDATATVKVNGIAVASGSASQDIALTVGKNIITTTVTAQDGTTAKTYTVTITRLKSPDATLVSLVPGNGSLFPSFTPLNTKYTLTTGNANSSINFVPIKSDPNASISVNGVAVVSGTASQAIPLDVGSANVVNIKITAEDGTVNNYTITITRHLSANADLANLVLTAGVLNEGFTAANTTYTASVLNSVKTIGLIPTLGDANASVKVNNIAVVSGSASADMPLKVGENTIYTVVTAADSTTKTYTVTVTRAKSDNAELANIIIDNGELSPGFTAGTYTYETPVVNAITQLKITPLVSEANASVTVNGINSTGASVSVPLAVGTNPITIVVTAQDGSTKTYSIIAIREASANAALSNLALSSGELTTGFASTSFSYKAQVPNAVSSLTIIPTSADAAATIKVMGDVVVNGNASNPIPLAVGPNVLTTIVTAQDGITTQTYTVTVTRLKSPNADLANLTLSPGSFLPYFSPGGTTYNATVANTDETIQVLPTTADAGATVKVNNVIVPSGSNSGNISLVLGSNPVNITVTAEDGTQKTYMVNVTRPQSSDASLADLSSTAGPLIPAFSSTTLPYDIPVENAVTSATLQPMANNAGATIQVDGLPVNSGSVSQALALKPGPNPYNIKITAADGTVETYVVTFVRKLSDNADLGSLLFTAGDINPAFTTANTSYELRIPYNVITTTVKAITSDADADLKVNGVTVKSGSFSPPVTIGSTSTIVAVTVTSASGKVKTYSVRVIRDAPPLSSNATLISLSTNEGSLTPSFTPGNTTYAVRVNANTGTINLTGITTDGGATIKINGTVVLSGSPSGDIPLTNGTNRILVVVTAADGITTKTYNVTVTRPALAMTLASVFTPNGDGVNDLWVLPGIEQFTDCTVKVFNRGGQLVFSSIGYRIPWDGTLNGKQLPPDVYYYIIDLKHEQGVRSGAITIMK